MAEQRRYQITIEVVDLETNQAIGHFDRTTNDYVIEFRNDPVITELDGRQFTLTNPGSCRIEWRD